MYFDCSYRVPYADTDQMGVVYYANYLEYFERGRTEMLRSGGLSYLEMEKRGIFLPVAEAHCRYIASARYDDELVFRTFVEEIRPVRLRIHTQVLCQERLLVDGYVILAAVDSNRKIIRLPADFVEKCRQFQIEPQEA